MVQEHGLSVRQACRAARLSGSAFYAPPCPRNDGPLIAAIELYVRENPRHGSDKLYPALWPQGFGKCRLYGAAARNRCSAGGNCPQPRFASRDLG